MVIINLMAGMITGFVVSLPPLGPIAFAVICKGFKNEIKEGRVIALGAAFMDFFFCLIAFMGITLIISIFPSGLADFYAANVKTIEIVLTFAGCLYQSEQTEGKNGKCGEASQNSDHQESELFWIVFFGRVVMSLFADSARFMDCHCRIFKRISFSQFLVSGRIGFFNRNVFGIVHPVLSHPFLRCYEK
jgi:hypothetical protein